MRFMAFKAKDCFRVTLTVEGPIEHFQGVPVPLGKKQLIIKYLNEDYFRSGEAEKTFKASFEKMMAKIKDGWELEL